MVIADLTALAVDAAQKASDVILEYYYRSDIVKIKNDGSPLTLADIKSHQIICKSLKVSNIPVISEESERNSNSSDIYWLIDPLDGTKDFLAKNNEFVVNIALIKNQVPVLGVILAPALKEIYVGMSGSAGWFKKNDVCINFDQYNISEGCRMAVSRFHDTNDVYLFAQENNIVKTIPIGSALKYGRLAIAEVDVFPRLVGSSEWDTAAGQAVLESAGGKILDWSTGLPLRYGKKNFRNPRLLAIRAPYSFHDFKLKIYKPELL